MKSKILVLGATFLIFLTVYAIEMSKSGKPTSNVIVEKSEVLANLDKSEWKLTPELEFEDLDGTNFSLKDFSGKVVLLNFWATWCPPCVKELPSMINLIDAFEGQVILLVVSNDHTKQAIYDLFRRMDDDFSGILEHPHIRFVWDEDKSITDDIFQTTRFPETIIISPEGFMARKVIGEYDWDNPEMKQYIMAILK